ncbi:TSUP family transporter [Sphingosinicella rhizophila]
MNQLVTPIIIAALVATALWFCVKWWRLERPRAAAGEEKRRLSPLDGLIGFIANFFDTLGIGSFATTTAMFKLGRRVADEQIPGTLNVGNALPTMTQALIFITIVTVDPLTLVTMIAAAVTGAWLGVGIVSRLPRRAIQIGMGSALLIAAVLLLASLLQWMPGGGEAVGLDGIKLVVAVAVSFLLGALMMLGIGLYAPCLILVSLLGINPLAAFPIMMGSCAFLMPAGGARFVATGRYSFKAALALALGGIPAVLIAAYFVKSLPLDWLRWLVLIVVIYAAATMLLSAWRDARGRAPSPEEAAPAVH